jgi:hypothetical protein
MKDELAFPLSWPKEKAVTIRSILLELDRPDFVGWPIKLSAPPKCAAQAAPLKVKMSGPAVGVR